MSVLSWLLLLIVPFLLLSLIKKGPPRIYAIRQVVRLFRKSNAVNPDTAKYQDELGFGPNKESGNPFIALIFGGWGFKDEEMKQDALRYLIKDGIVLSTSEGRLYLSELKLKSSGFYRE